MEVSLIRDEVCLRLVDMGNISVFWIKHEERDACCAELRGVDSSIVIVPVVVRVNGFDNPNSLFNDLAAVIQLAEPDLTSADVVEAVGSGAKLAIVLIAKTELKIAQTSSPMRLPSWFPMRGGTVVDIQIVDLTWSVNCPMSHSSLRLDEINSLIFDLDKVLSDLLLHASKGGALNQFLNFVRVCRKDSDLTLAEILQHSEDELGAVSGSSSYRLSLRIPKTPLALICQSVLANSPDKMPSAVGSVLFSSLSFGISVPVPLMALLVRPRPDQRPAEVFEWSAFCWAVLFSYQLSTAAAHADQYPHQPYHILRAYSFDVRRYLGAVLQELSHRLTPLLP